MEQTLRKRLLLGHASIVLVIVLSTATALVALRSGLRQTEVTSAIDRRITLIEHLRGDARELARTARRFLLTGDGKEQQHVLALEREMNQERTRIAMRDRTLDDRLDDYIDVVVSSLGNERVDPGAALARFEDGLLLVRGSLGVAFDGNIAHERAKLDASRSSQRLARGAQWALVIAAALGVVLTIGSSLAMRFLLRRQAERTRSAEAVAERATAQRNELLAASDELHRPLATIMTLATDLRTKGRPDEDVALQSIASNASRVDTLLRQLLDVTALQAGTVSLHRQSCDVAALVERAIARHRETAHERGIRLRFEAGLSRTVSADPERVLQVLISLLGIAIASARIGAEIVVSAAPTNDAIRFAVIDVGVAVPTPSTFRPAVATPPDDLVVHLSRRVIEAHGGRFGIESTASGRTCWFTLPTEPRLLR